MSVYVDKLVDYPESLVKKAARKNGFVWCHMYADTTEELIKMAISIGLRPEWIQNKGCSPGDEHFDLTPGKRRLAINAGAIEDKSHENLKRIYNENR